MYVCFLQTLNLVVMISSTYDERSETAASFHYSDFVHHAFMTFIAQLLLYYSTRKQEATKILHCTFVNVFTLTASASRTQGRQHVTSSRVTAAV